MQYIHSDTTLASILNSNWGDDWGTHQLHSSRMEQTVFTCLGPIKYVPHSSW